MPITFQCQKCKSGMTVPDSLAGKRGRCKKCQSILVVPQPGSSPAPLWAVDAPPPPIPPPADPVADAEEEAMKALAEPKEEEKAPEQIEFDCPQCGEPVKLPLDLGGKRHPCPSCTRVIAVPVPKVKTPSQWRDTGPKKPAGAKREDLPVPEGAWGAGQAAELSQETLEEAGLLPEKQRPLTWYQKWEMPILIGTPALLLLVAGYFLWGWLSANAEHSAFNRSVAPFTNEESAALAGQGGLAALRSEVARYLILARPRNDKAIAEARDHLKQAVGEAVSLSGLAADALLLELLDTHLMLGSVFKWDEAQRPIEQCLAAIQSPECRIVALRRMAAHLARAGEPARAQALAAGCTKALDQGARSEALAAVALQLHLEEKATQASRAAEAALAPYQDVASKSRPPLGPVTIAAAVALGKPVPKEKEKDPEEREALILGKILGRAIKGEGKEALDTPGLDDLSREAKCQAAAMLADGNPSKGAEAAIALATAGRRTEWANYRIALAALRAGVDPGPAIAALEGTPLKDWAELARLRASLKSSQAPGGDPLSLFEAGSPPSFLARVEVARKDGGSSARWKDWDAASAAFGWIGAAQALHSRSSATR